MGREHIAYVANARVPSERAHAYQVVQMCDAFATTGANVTLVVPDREQEAGCKQSLESFYDTPIDFAFRRIFCVDFLPFAPRVPSSVAKLIFYVQTITFALSAVVHLNRRPDEFDLIYSRALFFSCVMALMSSRPVVHEVHDMPRSRWRTTVVGRCFDRLRGVVPISEGLERDWAEYSEADTLVCPDGVQLEKFDLDGDLDIPAWRAELDLPTDATLVCYAGTLSTSRGVDVLVKSMNHFGEDIHLCLVGGDERQRSKLQALFDEFPENVTMVGHVKPHKVPRYLHVSDVLAVPNSMRNRRVAKHSSPLKLFECMAAGRPIVASNIPAHREIVDDSCAYFFEADNSRALATAIEEAAIDEDSDERVAKARERVERYTWESRAESILDYYGA